MSSNTHEILTVQLGHYANFVGTHWWNIQESSFVYNAQDVQDKKEVNHDVLFREGQNLLGDVTYTPRLVIVDLKGSLNTLKQDGCLYDLPEAGDDVTWGYDVTLHKGSSLPKNDFLKDLERSELELCAEKAESASQEEEGIDVDKDAAEEKESEPRVFGTKLYDLNNSVHVWSDYLRIHLHPRTIHVMEKYQHANELERFDMFGLGQMLYKDLDTHREIDDKLHFFLEECDQLQGVHVLADMCDGFGGLAASLLEDLQDELSNKSLMTFGVSPPNFPNSTATQDTYRVISTALTLQNLTNQSSAFVPLSLASSFGRHPGSSLDLPNVKYQPDLHYHTSAILAAGLDTASLPYRLEGAPSLLSHVTQAMTPYGRKILNLYSSLPFPLSSQVSIVDGLLDLGDELPWQPLTPGCDTKVNCTAQSLVTRGLHRVRLKGRTYNVERPRVLDRCDTLSEVLSLYSQEMSQCSLNAICNVRQTCKTTTPFPHIFTKNIDKDGFLNSQDRPENVGVESVSMVTSLQSSNAIKPALDRLITDVSAINIRRHHRLLESGLEEDELKEAFSNLATLRDNYDDSGGDMV